MNCSDNSDRSRDITEFELTEQRNGTNKMENPVFISSYNKCKFILCSVRSFEYLGNSPFGINEHSFKRKKSVHSFLKKYEVLKISLGLKLTSREMIFLEAS